MKTQSLNKNLTDAKKNKNDEFYTQLNDINRELQNYKEHFKDKIVYCNCDDPYESNFFKFFALNFSFWGIKKLIATCYVGSPIANTELSLFEDESEENKTTRVPHKIEITEIPDMNNDGAINLLDVELLLASDRNHLTRLKGDGDFRSEECVELLKEADIVVTNPPFSLFREYVAQLMEYDKKFLIIGDQNVAGCKEIFKFIKENKMWIGVDSGGTKWFKVPFDYEINTKSRIKIENGIKYFSKGTICWYTNLEHNKRYEKLLLYRDWNKETDRIFYQKYDNYDAIEVSTFKDIPLNYDGVMGVPITFLDKFNPEQFEIVGKTHNKEYAGKYLIGNNPGPMINGKILYHRILIKHKKPESKEEYNKRLDIKFSKNNN